MKVYESESEYENENEYENEYEYFDNENMIIFVIENECKILWSIF